MEIIYRSATLPYVIFLSPLQTIPVNKPKHLPSAPAKLARAAYIYIMHRVTPNGHRLP